jgi:hypothetical protein
MLCVAAAAPSPPAPVPPADAAPNYFEVRLVALRGVVGTVERLHVRPAGVNFVTDAACRRIAAREVKMLPCSRTLAELLRLRNLSWVDRVVLAEEDLVRLRDAVSAIEDSRGRKFKTE